VRPNGTPLHSAQFAAPFRQPSFVTPLQLNGATEAANPFSEPLTAYSPNGHAASVAEAWQAPPPSRFREGSVTVGQHFALVNNFFLELI
jgi:hypothetical protein